ncbi:MAG: hypothetical protein B1H02_00315 [Candidatus Latescibacteria bacterium 4484_107]|nr:MAG: hypothetical protein B1H02_00315 [Candidatus Latescibacteria bacterium 4484_107]
MAEKITEEQMNEMLFMQVIMMFQGAAMQQMGKLANPVSGKVERDLDQAKMSIDILGMLKEKTKGNVSDNEAKFLDHVLYELRINYVDEVNKAKREKTEGPAGKPDSQEEEKEEKEEAEASPKKEEEAKA